MFFSVVVGRCVGVAAAILECLELSKRQPPLFMAIMFPIALIISPFVVV
jgi:hypothetical protein